jgi:glycosyltransferase involved in cell wall biosynthesis
MIYNGYNEWFRPMEDPECVFARYMAERGYLFFLGNTDPKKNTERTLIAYSKYLERSSIKRKLLMADLDRQYLDDIIKRNHIENIRRNIFMPGYIVNTDLPYVYSAAFAFLYTSLRESFGIPLLEAMACGTPVVTSNTSSMPEIGGQDAILVNPENADEICDQLLRLEEDESFYQQQVEMGMKRAKLFSWKYTAEQLLSLYEIVYRESKR